MCLLFEINSAFKTLALALGDLCRQFQKEHSVIYEIINPKAISIGWLYGRFDAVSHEWSDGIYNTLITLELYCPQVSSPRPSVSMHQRNPKKENG